MAANVGRSVIFFAEHRQSHGPLGYHWLKNTDIAITSRPVALLLDGLWTHSLPLDRPTYAPTRSTMAFAPL